jgi:hypothetical protein
MFGFLFNNNRANCGCGEKFEESCGCGSKVCYVPKVCCEKKCKKVYEIREHRLCRDECKVDYQSVAVNFGGCERKNCGCGFKDCGCETKGFVGGWKDCGCEAKGFVGGWKDCGCEAKSFVGGWKDCGCEAKSFVGGWKDCGCETKGFVDGWKDCGCERKNCGCERQDCACERKNCCFERKNCGCSGGFLCGTAGLIRGCISRCGSEIFGGCGKKFDENIQYVAGCGCGKKPPCDCGCSKEKDDENKYSVGDFADCGGEFEGYEVLGFGNCGGRKKCGREES